MARQWRWPSRRVRARDSHSLSLVEAIKSIRSCRAVPSHRHGTSRHETVMPKGIGTTGLIAFFIISLLGNLQTWAASSQTTAPPPKVMGVSTPSVPSPIAPYVAQAYSIVGPSYVSTVTSGSITLYTGQNDLGIDLNGKNVTVLDQDSKPLTLSAVQKGRGPTEWRLPSLSGEEQ